MKIPHEDSPYCQDPAIHALKLRVEILEDILRKLFAHINKSIHVSLTLEELATAMQKIQETE